METHLLTLASSLPPSVRCVVCCLDASADYRARLTDLGIAHTDLACPNLLRPSGLLACRRFTRVVKHFDPHIVHSYGFSGDVVAALLRLGGARAPDHHQPAWRRAQRASSGHPPARQPPLGADRVRVARDRGVRPRDRVAGAAPDRDHREWRGAPSEREPSAVRSNRPIRFGTLGTVKPIKGPDLLVEAFMRFPPERPVELVIAGLIDRPWAEALRDRARSDTRIRFVGRTSAPRDFLSELDVFVLPSRSEGMSNALLEAMAAGLPCIATDVGSNRSVLVPGRRRRPPG